jgi:RNA polymerase sigma-70 factor (ECF subfamily)
MAKSSQNMSQEHKPKESTSQDLSQSPDDKFLQLLMGNDKRIYSFILSLVPNKSDADDLMQEATSLMWRKFSEFEPGSDFVAWGMKFAHNCILNFRKKKARSKLVFKGEIMELLEKESHSMVDKIDHRMSALQDCINKLPPKEARLIHMHYREGIQVKDLAPRVGFSIHQIYRALIRIHGILLRCIRRTVALEG